MSGPDGEALDEAQLQAELRRLTQQLTAIDASIQAAREQLANPRKAGEREVWETNVVILQVVIMLPGSICWLDTANSPMGKQQSAYSACDMSRLK